MSDPAHLEARPADGYAGDLTPQQAWDLLTSDPSAVLVDVRTDGEWRDVGVPDTAPLDRRAGARRVGRHPSGRPNPQFLEQLEEAGVTGGARRVPVPLGPALDRRRAAATAAGLGPAYNVLEGFEGASGADGHRGHHGWRAAGLPWRQA